MKKSDLIDLWISASIEWRNSAHGSELPAALAELEMLLVKTKGLLMEAGE
jgi:hypothetical protein